MSENGTACTISSDVKPEAFQENIVFQLKTSKRRVNGHRNYTVIINTSEKIRNLRW
jgi:hypothetical protein